MFKIKILNINLFNLLKGFIGIGTLREHLTDPHNLGEIYHEIAQFKGKQRHGNADYYFPTDGPKRKIILSGQFKLEKKYGFAETFHRTTAALESRTCFLNDVPHGWAEVYDEGGILIKRELYKNGELIDLPSDKNDNYA